MASNSSSEYKVVADKIVSPDEDIIINVRGDMYKGSVDEPNRYITASDIEGITGGSALNYVQVESEQVTITTSPQDLISLTITTTGAPVQINLTGEGSNAAAGSWVKVALHRDGTLIGQTIQIESSEVSENVPYALNFIDAVAAGEYVYSAKIVGKSSGNWQFGEVSGPIMNAVELTGFKGDDGASGGTADFVFNYDDGDEESTMTVANHDMIIRTTRTSDQDADISLNSADDIWLNAGDEIEIDATSTILLRANDGIFLNDQFEPNNQIATIGDIQEAGVADFVFTNVDTTNSSITVTGDKEVTIEAGATNDLNLRAGDQVWITANDGVVVQSDSSVQVRSQDSTRILTNFVDQGSAEHEWEFTNTGTLVFPDATIQTTAYTGGAGAGTGDITFVDSTISNDTGDDIVIQNKNQAGAVKARITLDQSNEQVLVEALRENDNWFNDSQWSTAVWSGTTVSITNTPDIINFFDTVPGNITRISINDGASVTYGGASYGSGNITIDVGGSPSVEQDPLTVTEIRFYYSQSSKMDINYDNGSFDIVSNGMSMLIDSSGDLELNSRDEDIDLRARDDIRFTTNWTSGGTQPQWRLTNDGRFELPGDGYIENVINGASDGSNSDTIKLVPDSFLLEDNNETADQYVVIDPTYNNHIHVRAGGAIDESTANLILGGERNKVSISDGDREVVVTSRPPRVINTYLNTNPESDTNFVTGDTADIQINYTVNVGGTDYVVDSVMAIDEGVVAVTATGAVFTAGQNYTFVFESPFDNQWTFDSDGTLYGPTEPGYVKVTGLYGQDNSPLALLGPQNVVISGDGGEFLDDASNPANQIAKIGDLSEESGVSFQSVRWSPNFEATGMVFSGSGETYPTYNSYYVKQGQLVSFWIAVDMVTVSDFGTGQYKLALPFAPLAGTMNHFSGWVNVDPTENPDLAGHIIVNADHLANTSVLDLHYIKQSGGANSPVMEAMLVQGTPVTMTTDTQIYVNGTYIAAADV